MQIWPGCTGGRRDGAAKASTIRRQRVQGIGPTVAANVVQRVEPELVGHEKEDVHCRRARWFATFATSPGASLNPAIRFVAKRPTQRFTCRRDMPMRRASTVSLRERRRSEQLPSLVRAQLDALPRLSPTDRHMIPAPLALSLASPRRAGRSGSAGPRRGCRLRRSSPPFCAPAITKLSFRCVVSDAIPQVNTDRANMITVGFDD